MSPILFVLYVNVLLFAIPHHLQTPPTQHESSHAFVDDLLYRSQSPKHIEEILSFFDRKGRAWGLDINLIKIELHSMGSAPQKLLSQRLMANNCPLWTPPHVLRGGSTNILDSICSQTQTQP